MPTYSLEEMTTQIELRVNNMAKEVLQDTLKELEKSAIKAKEKVSQTAPRSNRNVELHLADSFDIKKLGYGSQTHYKIWSPEHWRMVHLVELGFTHYKSNKYVMGKRFMFSAYDEAIKELKNNIGNAIKKDTN